MKRYISCSTDKHNVFDTTSTHISYYDSFLNKKDLEYMQTSKNRTGSVVMMSPKEYYSECASNIFNSSVESLKAQRNSDSELIKQYKDDMQNGDVFPLCYLNYADHSQEGLHRMLAAGEAFGWDTKFPVLVVNVVDLHQEELNSIWRDWCDAVYQAQKYTYSADNWEDEIVEEIEYELNEDLDKHYDVIITDRRSKEECDKFDLEYAIDVKIKQFEDIMNSRTLFTPNLQTEEEDNTSADIDIDDIDLDDIDLDDLLLTV